MSGALFGLSVSDADKVAAPERSHLVKILGLPHTSGRDAVCSMVLLPLSLAA
jgi:hypothetical protein